MMELDGWAIANVIAKWTLYVATLLSVGGTLFRIVFGEQAPLSPELKMSTMIGAIIAASATGSLLLLQAGLLAGEGMRGLFDAEMLALVWTTPAGDAAAVRWVGCALLFAASVMSGWLATFSPTSGPLRAGIFHL